MEKNPLIISDQERLALLYERFRDVCLVEKEVWTEIYMPRQIEKGMVHRAVERVAGSSDLRPSALCPCYSWLRYH